MAPAGRSGFSNIFDRLRAAFLGPQLAAFIPAIMLGAYWFGGEGFLVALAVIIPAALALSDVVGRARRTNRGGRDPVTGLPGAEQALIWMAQHARGRQTARRAVGCFVLELDDFSALRVRHGAEAAEQILNRCCDRIRGVLRDGDMIAQSATARFVIVYEKTRRTDLEAMIQTAARLQNAVSEPIPVSGLPVVVTASIGFALSNRVEQQTPRAWLAAAEAALRDARKSGPRSVRSYTARMPVADVSASRDREDVLHALEQGQIVPWFQPQLSTDTGDVSGIEALARWQHPEFGLMLPGAFLPAIAEAGLSERLGEVMLFKSLTAMRDWDRAGIQVPSVAVNFSAEELGNPRLFDKIRWELDRFDLEPGRLTVEILETVIAQSADDVIARNIAALSALGCKIDLDDFGTGHASISSIRRFEVDRLKIDRSFVTHVDIDRDQQNMVAAILTMADRLGLDTLAEGVETIGEHSMLAQLGCGHVQGYSIARPMPFEDLAPWLLDHREKLAKTPVLPRRAG